MNHRESCTPVIDLFAGPGGLGEGFASFKSNGLSPFDVRLSIEKDFAAHQTLELRAFYRQFRGSPVPESYYQCLRGEVSREELYERHPREAQAAGEEARHAELGSSNIDPNTVDEWVRDALGGANNWVLIGGPPCQPYSIAGRSRRKGISGYRLEEDARHDLYKEYLRFITRHWPTVFVMENVKGLLSSKVNNELIWTRILDDLSDPAWAVSGAGMQDGDRFHYRMYSLVETTQPGLDGVPLNPATDYLIECEKYGVPQTRHRVILLGVRDDVRMRPRTLKPSREVTAGDVLEGLPRLRGGVSRDSQGRISHSADSKGAWKEVMGRILRNGLRRSIQKCAGTDVLDAIERTISTLRCPKQNRGSEFVKYAAQIKYAPEWYLDPRLKGVCNSTTRVHLPEDLHRYLYAACFANVHERSPVLGDFPEELLPEHKNVNRSLKSGNFADRFRVQLRNRPATTVVSHIAKDGHYYIHYDPTQARSLTVREVARLQTFPDNYFFCGNRTEQYTQVGNAVPPILARQVAGIVFELIGQEETESKNGRRNIA